MPRKADTEVQTIAFDGPATVVDLFDAVAELLDAGKGDLEVRVAVSLGANRYGSKVKKVSA